MIYYVDIDETICRGDKVDSNYENSKPIYSRIEKINQLFDEGHIIVYWTARGMKTGKNWYEFTKKQLDSWGCKYNSLWVGKPSFDYFIDDKAFNSEDFFNE